MPEPLKSYKPGFGVVTFVLVVLCGLGMFATAVRPWIPPGKPNALKESTEGFLQQGMFEPVRWMEANSDTVQLAIKSRKPMLLLIGSAASAAGRNLDNTVFNQREIAAGINTTFISIRIDSMHHPEFANCFLPFLRNEMANFWDMQCWVLNPTGELRCGIVTPEPLDGIDAATFTRALDEVRRQIDGRHPSPPVNQVSEERFNQFLGNAPAQIPPVSDYVASMINESRRDLDGRESRLYPNAWRFMAATGKTKLADNILQNIIFSPQYDWVEGGFYHLRYENSPQTIEFDKYAIENAEMVTTLAMVGIMSHDDSALYAAQATHRFLVDQMAPVDMIVGARIGDEMRNARSRRSSFSPPKFFNAISEDRDETRRWFNLHLFSNPQLIPFVRNKADWDANRQFIDDQIERFRTSLPKRFPATGPRLATVNGTVVARLLEYARLVDLRSSLDRTIKLAENLENVRLESEILLSSDSIDYRTSSFAAYLAYADAMCQLYLLQGDNSALDRGVTILNRAVTEFQVGRPGFYSLIRPGTSPFQNTEVPEIVDNGHESCSAQAIRLFTTYGRILSDQPVGSNFLRLAGEATRAFGRIAHRGSYKLASYFSTSSSNLDENYALVVGPNATTIAAELYRLRPTRLIAPAVGTVQKDLQSKTQGIYVVSGTNIKGPLTLNEAESLLPLEVHPSVSP